TTVDAKNKAPIPIIIILSFIALYLTHIIITIIMCVYFFFSFEIIPVFSVTIQYRWEKVSGTISHYKVRFILSLTSFARFILSLTPFAGRQSSSALTP